MRIPRSRRIRHDRRSRVEPSAPDGYALVAAGRSIETAECRFPFVQWTAADFHQLLTVEAWLPLWMRS